MLDACLMSVEEGQELSTRRLGIFLIVFLFSIILLALILLIQFLHLCRLRALHLNTKVSNFFLVPVERYRNVVVSKIVVHETIGLCVIDMEAVVDC